MSTTMMSSADPSREPLVLDGPAKEGLYSFAYSMLQADNVSVAIRAFRVFVRFAPTDERAWLGLGACHEKLDQEDVALELYGAGAMIADPPSARCHLGVARLSDDRATMLEYLERARELAEDAGDETAVRVANAMETSA